MTINDRQLSGQALRGVRKGQYSIRINDEWRVCFEWRDSAPGPVNVEVADYTKEGRTP